MQIQETKYITMQAPILTRWWTVFVAAVFVKENWNFFVRMASVTLNKVKKQDKLYLIADSIRDLTSIDEI